MRRLGPAWEGQGRPPDGFFTRRTAEHELQAILTDARRGQLPGAITTGASFADAAAEWLRYVEHDRKRRPSTIEDYRNVVRNNLLPEFGEAPLEQVTTDWIDAFRAGLVAEGRLSPHDQQAARAAAWDLRSCPASLRARRQSRRGG
jgi:hypothetical protein